MSRMVKCSSSAKPLTLGPQGACHTFDPKALCGSYAPANKEAGGIVCPDGMTSCEPGKVPYCSLPDCQGLDGAYDASTMCCDEKYNSCLTHLPNSCDGYGFEGSPQKPTFCKM